jgi:hypothetical protein
MLCNGFVQTDTSYYLGSRIAKTSTYDGEMIEMPISLNQVISRHKHFKFKIFRFRLKALCYKEYTTYNLYKIKICSTS